MDMSSIMQMGAQVLQSKMSGGEGLDTNDIMGAIAGLTDGGGDNGIDIGSIVSNLQGNGDSGLMGMAASWLGDGENQALDPSMVGNILGEDKVAGFAEKLGVSQEDAAGGLAAMLPEVVNQASSGGSMMDIAGMAASALGGQSGGAGGLLGGIMGKVFGR